MKNDTEQKCFLFFPHRLRYKNNNRNSERAAGHEERERCFGSNDKARETQRREENREREKRDKHRNVVRNMSGRQRGKGVF